MKIFVDLNNYDEQTAGEILRGIVFNQFDDFLRIYQRGCYSTFNVNSGFEEIVPTKYPAIYKIAEPLSPEDGIKVTAYESGGVVAMWWWDGDGDLTIWVKDTKFAFNNPDCKCDYTWRIVEVEQ